MLVTALLAVCAAARVGAAQEAADAGAMRVESPDGKVVVEFLMRGDVATYRVMYVGKPVVLESKLGFLPGMAGGYSKKGTDRSEHVSVWTNKLGERSTVPDKYRELQVGLKHAS